MAKIEETRQMVEPDPPEPQPEPKHELATKDGEPDKTVPAEPDAA